MSDRKLNDAQEVDFWRLVDRHILPSFDPDDEASYTNALTKFLKVSRGQFYEQHKIFLMRVGLRSLMNDAWGRRRSQLKAEIATCWHDNKPPPPAAHAALVDEVHHALERKKEERELTSERNARTVRQRKEARQYAAEHGIPLDDVGAHRAGVSMRIAVSALEEYACKRAADILSSWFCDGGRPLGNCTKADLVRLGERERNVGQGHLATATFYLSLAEHCATEQTVCSMDAAVIVECFNVAFGAGHKQSREPVTPSRIVAPVGE